MARFPRISQALSNIFDSSLLALKGIYPWTVVFPRPKQIEVQAGCPIHLSILSQADGPGVL